jgi:tripartite-type tricarboxylate transporter receptor subunit TctC
MRADAREGHMKLQLIPLAMAIAAGVGSACGPASAQNYPTKPIALVVPFQAGSTTDILGRILAGKLSESIGQRVIVDNRAGAGGSIGTEYVARAAPDGYTIVLGTVSTHAINASIYSKLPYDPIKDFAPVIEFGAVPQVLVVNSSLPVRSVQDLIEYARARPGKVTYGSAGNGTTNHLSGALLGAREKLQLVHVPYRGNLVLQNTA